MQRKGPQYDAAVDTADSTRRVNIHHRTESQTPVQLNIVAPRAIESGQTFSSTIALDSAVRTKSRFSLAFEAEALDIVSVIPATQQPKLAYEPSEGRIAFSLDPASVARQSDILATVSFRVRPTTAPRTSTLELQPIDDGDSATLPLTGLSLQLQIMPASTDEHLDTDTLPAPNDVGP
jgi:hypothetical protein